MKWCVYYALVGIGVLCINLYATASSLPEKKGIRIIVIDPGHGGKDPGAIGSTGLKEKDVTLKIALMVKASLSLKNTCRVFLTRSTDVFIPLAERVSFANRKKADLFISIHTNSIAGSTVVKSDISGYKIYFLSEAGSEQDQAAARIENAVLLLESQAETQGLQNVLDDMAHNEFLAESQELAILLAETFTQKLKGKIKPLEKGVGQANFRVLNGAFMPSTLIETCFISNPSEEQLLSSPEFHKRVGEAIARAILQFKKKFEVGL